MIIKQRQTILDPLLLKVVFPYLDSDHHSALLRLASFWNAEIRSRPAPRRARAWREEVRAHYARLSERWQRAVGELSSNLQPQRHALVSVSVTDERPRGRQQYRGERQ
ncbi:MAG: hypothetical protein ACYC4L_02470 [Chloroflexota bacterium]